MTLAAGSFVVACRVDGVIHKYLFGAETSVEVARQTVQHGVEGANPILALIVSKEKKDGNEKSGDKFSHTTNPDRA